jgi:TetR/AcrR family transcriptional repressor of bet genes
VYQRRLKSNLTHALRPLCPAPREVAQTAAALIDGLYIHALSDPATPDAQAAIATVEAYLDGVIK